jgi:hypothetical protein
VSKNGLHLLGACCGELPILTALLHVGCCNLDGPGSLGAREDCAGGCSVGVGAGGVECPGGPATGAAQTQNHSGSDASVNQMCQQQLEQVQVVSTCHYVQLANWGESKQACLPLLPIPSDTQNRSGGPGGLTSRMTGGRRWSWSQCRWQSRQQRSSPRQRWCSCPH